MQLVRYFFHKSSSYARSFAESITDSFSCLDRYLMTDTLETLNSKRNVAGVLQ